MQRMQMLLSLATSSLAACYGPTGVQSDATEDTLSLCANFRPYTAALAEAIVACTGTIGPNSLDDSSGILRRTFDHCVTPQDSERNAIQDVDDILGLQKVDAQLQDCIVEPWKGWRRRLGVIGPTACPTWEKIGKAVMPRTVEQVAQNLPDLNTRAETSLGTQLLDSTNHANRSQMEVPIGEQDFYYRVRLDANGGTTGGCETAEACAGECAAGLAGFYLGVQEGLVVGDPLWWLDPTVYTPASSNPYLTPGYYHPMSFYGDLPGARYGHRNRVGEACSYYNGYTHMLARLYLYCIEDQDISTCTSVCIP